MNKQALLLVAGICLIGCASEKSRIWYPPIPCSDCGTAPSCTDKAKQVSATGAIIVIEATDEFLQFLQRTEKYLQTKLEEFEKNNPELVDETKDALDKIRDRIKEYKENLIKRF